MHDDVCVHFTGYARPPCRAGIHYAAFSGRAMPSRDNLPCFAGSHVECKKRVWPVFEAMPHSNPLTKKAK